MYTAHTLIVQTVSHRKKVPKQLKGSYQHPPPVHSKVFSQNDSSLSVPDKTKAICRFANSESNCWLNATLQSILHLQVVQDKLKQLTPTSMVQMSSMPVNLAALIQEFFQNPGHTFDTKTIHGVTQELVKSIPALSLSRHNYPLDLIHKLLIWLDMCSVQTTAIAQHTDICKKCGAKVESSSHTPYIFELPLPWTQKGVSLTSLFEHAITEGESQQSCTACGSAMKRQMCWIDSPDVITLSLSRVGNDGRVSHMSVVPSDLITIPICDSSEIKYKLGSIICHVGSLSKAGHFWAHLLSDNDVIKADDKIIKILQPANAGKVANRHGCIYFYVKCNDAPLKAGITIEDNLEDIGSDSALPITAGTLSDVDVFCNERPNDNVCEAIPLPILTFLKQTSAFQKCHTRLTAAAAQSPALFRKALEKLNVANTHVVSLVSQQFSKTDVCTILNSFVEDTLGAPFLGNDLLCLKSLGRYICIQCGDQAVPSRKNMSQLIVQPLEVSQKAILDTVAQIFPAQLDQCETCKQENLSLSTYEIIHSPQTLLLLLRSGAELPKTFTLSCLYHQNDYAVSSICAFFDKAPYVSLYTCKDQQWHMNSNASKDTAGYTFELMQKILTTASFFVVSYEKTKSVKRINFQQVKQKHKCTDRCQQHKQTGDTQVPTTKLEKSPKGTPCLLAEDFACVDNSGWLDDKTIDVYHQLLLSSVDKKAHICPSTFVSQQLRSVWCDDISVLPDVPRASHNWWNYELVILPVNAKSHWGAIAVDFSNKTVKGDVVVLDVTIMDSLRVYEQDLVKVFFPLQRYLTLQYFALYGRGMSITFRYECYHRCPNFIAQTDGSSCGIFTCLFSKAVLFDVSLNTFKSEREKRDCVNLLRPGTHLCLISRFLCL